MAKKTTDYKSELLKLRIEAGIVQKHDCSVEENKEYSERISKGEPLPENVYRYEEATEYFYRIYEPELTDEERREYIQLLKLRKLNTIRNCTIFFTVLVILSIIATVIYSLHIASLLH